tara:strand:+ start:835 stop:1116 length:282 start_codon:yes stop_codon:yes gene_type:complete
MKVGDLVLTDDILPRRHSWKMGIIVEELKCLVTHDTRLFHVKVGNEIVRCWGRNLLCEEAYRGRSGSPGFSGPSILPWGGAKWKTAATVGGDQ